MICIGLFLLWSCATATPRGHGKLDKFLLCGEKFSVITMAKAAFLGSRLFEACAKGVFTEYQVPSSVMQKGITSTCFAIRACYERHQSLQSEDVEKFKNEIANCVPKVLFSVGNLNEKYYTCGIGTYRNLIFTIQVFKIPQLDLGLPGCTVALPIAI
ncbi:uncharacterized protein LOC135397931 [Ornithodoros turicata]|uniref:uncharacterized protein LOC135397931 n=1 Tax=Ornithodoros turicata TaxID=34597 RepID=UPI003138DB01